MKLGVVGFAKFNAAGGLLFVQQAYLGDLAFLLFLLAEDAMRILELCVWDFNLRFWTFERRLKNGGVRLGCTPECEVPGGGTKCRGMLTL